MAEPGRVSQGMVKLTAVVGFANLTARSNTATAALAKRHCGTPRSSRKRFKPASLQVMQPRGWLVKTETHMAIVFVKDAS